MPVEITLPLTKLEQVVADARKHEQVMAAKVEDAKLTLKAAKTAWEEAVGEVFRALDEMIADKKQPRLPFCDDRDDDTGKESDPEPTPPGPGDGGSGNSEPVATTITIIQPDGSVRTENGVRSEDFPVESALALSAASESQVAPAWRSLIVADELDAEPSIFAQLAAFEVRTLGELADALKYGRTFNLYPLQVIDLQEAIEQVSADDPEPITFNREIAVTVKGEPVANAVEPESAVEPEKPAKRGRGRRAKAESSPKSEPVAEPEPVPETSSGYDDI